VSSSRRAALHIRRQSIHARFTEVEVVLRYKSNHSRPN
jgi:hypothetical protein